MQLLKNGNFTPDTWVRLEEGMQIPKSGDVVVAFDCLVDCLAEASGRTGRLAVAFPNDRSIDALAPYLDRIDAVFLSFPAFTDGRAYSQARQLRHDFDFDGEILASGNVLPDQIAFMRQCGIDVFHINGRFALEHWQKAATAMTLSYQRGYAPARGFAPADVWSRREAGNDDTLRPDFKEVWSA